MAAVAKGGAVAALGTVGGLLLKLASGVIVIRILEKSEFGLISLGYVLISVTTALLIFGIGDGLPRFIAQVRIRESGEVNVGELVGTSLVISLVACFLGVYGISVFDGQIAASMSKPALEPVISAFAWMIPPLILTRNLSAVFQGLQYARPKVIFEDWAADIVRLLLIIAFVFVGVTFESVISAYVISVWVAFLSYAVYSMRYFHSRVPLSINVDRGRELLAFSLPLLAVSLVNKISAWSGIAILGFSQTASEIAIYNGPVRVVAILLVPLTSLGFIYTPASTRLFTASDNDGLRALYVSTTKWASIICLCIAAFFIADADFVVTLLFGEDYAESANILRVFSIGYCFHTLAGPNGATLISVGETKKIFLSTFLGGMTAIVVSLMLVGTTGAMGVAIGTSCGMISSNLLLSFFLFRTTGIHGFTSGNLCVLFVAATICVVWFFTMNWVPIDEWLLHFFVSIVFGIAILTSPFWLKQISKSDMEMIGSIEEKFTKSKKWSIRISKNLRL
ncbi:MAG: flippase [Halioglobus sp.]